MAICIISALKVPNNFTSQIELTQVQFWKGVENGINTLKDNVCWAIGSGTAIRLGLEPRLTSRHAGRVNSLDAS